MSQCACNIAVQDSGFGEGGTYEFSSFAKIIAFRTPLGFAAVGFESFFGEQYKGSCYVVDVDDLGTNDQYAKSRHVLLQPD